MKLGHVQKFIIYKIGFNKVRVKDLAEAYGGKTIGSSWATVSRALKSLKNDGLVEKDGDDYCLSSQGLNVFKINFPEEWNMTETETLRSAMKKIVASLPLSHIETSRSVQLIVFGIIAQTGQVSIEELSDLTTMNEDLCLRIVQKLVARSLLEKDKDMYRIHQQRLQEVFDKYS